MAVETGAPAKTIYKFGTSGYRNDRDEGFNAAVVTQITCAIADALIEEMLAQKAVRPVLVGGDTRPKTKMAIPIIIETLMQRGLDVYEVQGDIPTPVLAYAAANLSKITGSGQESAGAILMTASHNPWNYGGYNFLTPDGAIAPSSLSEKFEAYQAEPLNLSVDRAAFGLPTEPKCISILPYESYLKHLIEQVEINVDALKAANLHIAYDPLYATGRHYFPKLLEDLGVTQVKVIHNDDAPPEGYEGEPEPSAENLTELAELVRKWQAQHPDALVMGFSNDGDSDRFGVLDEQGNFIHPNTVLQLVAYLLTQHRGKTQGVIARSQSTTQALDVVAERGGLGILQTPVGYKFLAEAFVEYAEHDHLPDIILGGESSGGLSIQGHVPEKDGLLANLLVAELVAQEKRPLSQIIQQVQSLAGRHYIMAEWAIRTELKSTVLKKAKTLYDEGGSVHANAVVDVARSHREAEALMEKFGTKDGVKLYLTNGDWILLRASGTEPLIRLYMECSGETEAAARDAVETLAQFWLDYLENLGIDNSAIKRRA